MVLVEDLGILEYGSKPNKARFGIYACEACKRTFTRRIATMTDSYSICSSCQSKRANEASCNIRVARGFTKFILDARVIHGDRYEYTKVVYHGEKVPVTIICKIHAEFQQIPGDHIRHKSGCPKCAVRGGWGVHKYNYSSSCILYLVYFPQLNLYKIGVTSRSIEVRIKETKIQYEVISTINFKYGAHAYLVEQRLLRNYSTIRYTGKKVLGKGGDSELLTQQPTDFIYDVGMCKTLLKDYQ